MALTLVLCLVLLSLVLPGQIVQAVLLGPVNLGFETGDFTDWTLGTVSDGVYVVDPDGFKTPPEGSYMARLGTASHNGYQNPGPNQIYQDFVPAACSFSFVYNITPGTTQA
jgi:hypothetical protein